MTPTEERYQTALRRAYLWFKGHSFATGQEEVNLTLETDWDSAEFNWFRNGFLAGAKYAGQKQGSE